MNVFCWKKKKKKTRILCTESQTESFRISPLHVVCEQMEDSLAYLARGLHPTDKAEEHYHPGDSQAAQDGEADFTKVPYAI